MPFRYAPLRAVLAVCEIPPAPRAGPGIRSFHTSTARRQDGPSKDQNHYEALNVSPDASPADIKKSFYALSKTHHPDHNPSDPHTASKRFMRINEAYAVLGHADKRARYDRDVLRRHHRAQHQAHPHARTGSYHSTNTGPAGGRPASGLSSRRRGTFTGPPPSFYRSGGWGEHGAKRRAAHEESTGTGTGTGSGGSASSSSSSSGAGSSGGGGTGWSWAQESAFYGSRGSSVPHFDRDAHERTHRRGDERRARRRAGKEVSFVPDTGAVAGFFLIAGVLVVGVSAPVLFSWKTGPTRTAAAAAAPTTTSGENGRKPKNVGVDGKG